MRVTTSAAVLTAPSPRWPLREAAAELFLVENIEVGAGAHYTGELLCTHRMGPNRNNEVIRAMKGFHSLLYA